MDNTATTTQTDNHQELFYWRSCLKAKISPKTPVKYCREDRDHGTDFPNAAWNNNPSQTPLRCCDPWFMINIMSSRPGRRWACFITWRPSYRLLMSWLWISVCLFVSFLSNCHQGPLTRANSPSSRSTVQPVTTVHGYWYMFHLGCVIGPIPVVTVNDESWAFYVHEFSSTRDSTVKQWGFLGGLSSDHVPIEIYTHVMC